MKDSTPITRDRLDPQFHSAPQNLTKLMPHIRAATTAVHPVLLSPGKALKHMEIQQSNQVGLFFPTHLLVLVVVLTHFQVFIDFLWGSAPFTVLMMEQNRNGDSSGGGRIQSFLSACSATLCCCCLWNLLGQCF